MSPRPPPTAARRLLQVRSQVSTRTTSDHWLEWRRNAYTRCIQATTWAAILFYAETTRNFSILNTQHSAKDFIVQIMTFLRDNKILHHLDVKAGPWPAHGSAPGCPRRYFHIGRWLQNQNNRQSEQPSQERESKVLLESSPWQVVTRNT